MASCWCRCSYSVGLRCRGWSAGGGGCRSTRCTRRSASGRARGWRSVRGGGALSRGRRRTSRRARCPRGRRSSPSRGRCRTAWRRRRRRGWCIGSRDRSARPGARRAAGGDGHAERVEDELALEVVAHRPADDPAAEDVLDGGEEEEALPGLDVLEVADPEPVGLRPREAPVDEVRRGGALRVADRRARPAAPAVGATQAELAHQPRDPLRATRSPWSSRSSAWIRGAP